MPSIPSNKPYRVGRSRTGLGLFATKPIKKGTKIIRYFGPLLDSKKKKDDAIENKYLFELNDRWTIDGSVRKNIARYINHACKPNCYSQIVGKDIWIRAGRSIEPRAAGAWLAHALAAEAGGTIQLSDPSAEVLLIGVTLPKS